MRKKCGAQQVDDAFESITTALKQSVKNGTLVAKVKQVADSLPNTVDLDVTSFVKPTTYEASACSGRDSGSDVDTNHFTSDCSAATSDGDTCDLTVVEGYEGGSLTCDLSTGQYIAVSASPLPTALPSPSPSTSLPPTAVPVPAPSAAPSSIPTAMPVPAPINRTVLLVSVPLSASMELLTLSWVSNDSAIDSVVARSYGGE